MKFTSLAVLALALNTSAFAATVQTYECEGKNYDDNGFSSGQIYGVLKVYNPEKVMELLERKNKLTQAQARKYFTVNDKGAFAAEIADGMLYVNGNMRSYVRSIGVEVESLNRTGKGIKGEVTDMGGTGNEGGNVKCISTINCPPFKSFGGCR